ncbi:hypothetical protein [Thiococcus pfennigii]|jgi:hypothetical protein|uniref:hypothetical protein n=1 Tax=Thiococcus pfennigii TaxID=1057 RepID=UPI001906ED98|nr:hypothetical protein [Thiococcus pfennigii]MBK1702349.1 hypothetical protein [Thiococcus pfennigii]MBK1732586.1 hypothetical protein [Thiococcus pfennigii]
MDDETLLSAYPEVDGRLCPFEKGILATQAGCRQARRFCVAERLGVRCNTDAAHARCRTFIDLVRRQARFALRTLDPEAALTHANAVRIQVGALRGVRTLLAPTVPARAPIVDIDGLLRAAANRFEDLDGLPWPPIIQQIAAYEGGRPSRRSR